MAARGEATKELGEVQAACCKLASKDTGGVEGNCPGRLVHGIATCPVLAGTEIGAKDALSMCLWLEKATSN